MPNKFTDLFICSTPERSYTAAASIIALCALAIPAFGQTPAVTSATALDGPTGCTGMSAPYQDAPFCAVPNLLPLGSWAPYTRSSLAYTDPNFGGQVTTIAPFGNSSPYLIHMYSYPSPWSRNKKYLLALDGSGTLYLLDGQTGGLLQSGLPYNGGPQWFVWDATSDDIYYYISGTAIYQYTISTKSSSLVYDFGVHQGFTSLYTGGNDEITPNSITAVYDPNTQQACAINLTTVQVYCGTWNTSTITENGTLSVSNPDYIETTKGVDSVTGKQYVILLASPSAVIWSIDTTNGTLDFEFRGPEFDSTFDASDGNHDGTCDPGDLCISSVGGPDHGAAYQDAAGKQYWLSLADFYLQGHWTRALFAFPFSAGIQMATQTINGGGAQLVFVVGVGLPTVDVHVGCASNAATPTCVVSTVYEEGSPDPTTAPSTTVPHYEEIFTVTGLTSVVRIASTYSIVSSADSYYSQSRAAISPDGSSILFDSNFGVPNHWFINMVNTQAGSAQEGGALSSPPAVASMALQQASITAGLSLTANYVYLTSAAPTGGALITLSSSSPSAAAVPASITVPAGTTSASFPVTTYAVASPVNATITAFGGGGSSVSAPLTVNPPQVSNLTLSPASISAGLTSTANVVSIGSPAPAGGVAVQLSSSNTTVAQVPAGVTIPASATSASFSIATSSVTSSTQVTITAAAGGVSQSLPLTVNPPQLASLTISPTSITGGGTSSTNSVVLTSIAPAGGMVVTLQSNNTAVDVPARVTVPAGATSAPFTLTTSAVAAPAQVTITAIAHATLTATLTLNPAPVTVSSVTLSPASVSGGKSTKGSVTLASPAPTGGVIVSLAISDSSIAQVPASVTIPAGAASATFNVTTSPVAATARVTITASATGTSASAPLTVKSASLKSLALSSSNAAGGVTSSTNTLTLDSVSPSSGTTVFLTSSNNGAATVPTQVTVPPGASSTSFSIGTTPVNTSTTVTITASAGDGTQSLPLTVNAPQLSYYTIYPTTISGGLSSGVNFVYISSAAPTGGTVVNLTSSNPAVAQVPATITIPAGATSATFTISTTSVAAQSRATITASAGGASKDLSLTITPPQVSYLTIYPTTISGGLSSSVNYVYISSAAPTGGTVVNLTSSNPAVAQVPATITIPAGATSATFAITTVSVASQTTATITANGGGASLSRTLTITPPYVSYMTLYPASISGGTATTVNFVYLSSAAPTGGVVVSFTSSNPAVAQVLPASIIIPAGSSSATFAVQTTAVQAATPITITASGGGAQQTASLTVTP